MTKAQFIAEAKARGKSKEDTLRKYQELDAKGFFDDSVNAGSRTGTEVPRPVEPMVQSGDVDDSNPGLLSRIKQSWQERSKSAYNTLASPDRSLSSKILAVPGEAAGLINDVAGEAVAPVVTGALKTPMGFGINKTVGDVIAKTPVGFKQGTVEQIAQKVGKKAQNVQNKRPELYENLARAANISSVVPVAKAGQVVSEGVRTAAAPAGKVLVKAGERVLREAVEPGMPTRMAAHVSNVNPKALNDIVTGKVKYSDVKQIAKEGNIGYDQGQRLKDVLENPNIHLAEQETVNKALSQMPSFDLNPMVGSITEKINETIPFAGGARVKAKLEKLRDQLTAMKTPEAVKGEKSASLWDWARKNKVNDEAFRPYIGSRSGEAGDFIRIKSKNGLNETELAERFSADHPDLALYYDIVDENGLITNPNNLMELLADPVAAKKVKLSTTKQGDMFGDFINENLDPNIPVSAAKYKEMRRMLDAEIDWNNPAEASLLDEKLIPLRREMKNDLIRAAKDSGLDKEYVTAMESWANNIDMVSELRRRVGTNPQQFMNNVMSAANKARDKKLLQALDDLTGSNFSEEARKLATVKGLGLNEQKQTLFGISNAATGLFLAGGAIGGGVAGSEGGWAGRGVGAAAGALAFSPLGAFMGLRAGNVVKRNVGKTLLKTGKAIEKSSPVYGVPNYDSKYLENYRVGGKK